MAKKVLPLSLLTSFGQWSSVKSLSIFNRQSLISGDGSEMSANGMPGDVTIRLNVLPSR